MNPSPKSEPVGRRSLWLAWLLLAGVVAVALSTRTLTPIDETRYVSVAWEMWLRGDFLVPYINGEFYSHKPPFLFWVFHAGWALMGVHDWWPRLVSPLFSAGGLGLTFLLARRLWPQRSGVAGDAALILVSTLWWTMMSTATMFDIVLGFWVLVGMHGILRAAEDRRSGWLVLGAAIGMGVLTKGPVVLLNLMPVALLAPWWQPGLRRSRWYGGLLGAFLLGAAIALAWAIPAAMVGGEAYRNAIFWGQTAGRMVDSFAHRQPFWWYLTMLPLVLFPWFYWPGLWRSLATLRAGVSDPGVRFCVAWLVPVFVAFSLVSGKQLHYLVPMLPGFALLAARALDDRPLPGIALPAIVAAAVGLGLVVVGAGAVASLRERVLALPLAWPGLVVALAAGLAWWLVRRGWRPTRVMSVMACVLLALLLVAVQRTIGPIYDVKGMALAVRASQEQGRTVANLQNYHAQYQFLGRLEKPLVNLSGGRDEQLLWLAAHPDARVVLYVMKPGDLDGAQVLYKQPYRGGAAALVEAPIARSMLAADTAGRVIDER